MVIMVKSKVQIIVIVVTKVIETQRGSMKGVGGREADTTHSDQDGTDRKANGRGGKLG